MEENIHISTDAELTALSHRAIWETSLEDLKTLQVSEFSLFNDNYWIRKSTRPGSGGKHIRLNWHILLSNNSLLTDPCNEVSLMWAKKLMAILLLCPSNGYVLSVGSESSLRRSFQILISWMVEHKYDHPNQLTPSVIDDYINDLPEFLIKLFDSEDLSVSRVSYGLKVLNHLWTERRVMELWGFPTLTSNPFLIVKLNTLATKVATTARSWIQPLPDEVAIPLFNKASWFLGKPADDVVKLLDIIRDPIGALEFIYIDSHRAGVPFKRKQRPGKDNVTRQKRASKFLETFQFETLEGECEPWHESFNDYIKRVEGSSAKARVRQLFDAVRSACGIVIQGTTGMRISELMSIKAGYEPGTKLPKGVRVESSITGLYDVYVIRTEISKTEKGLPRQVDWILGMSPKGSVDVPLPVRALRVMNRLTEPWRPAYQGEELFIMDTGGETFRRKGTSQRPMKSYVMTEGIRRFIERWIDLMHLPDESQHKIDVDDLKKWRETKGAIFTTHMLRKSWAQFIFAVNPSLTPAIQLQFHHLSLAMTDTGYIGANPLLMQSMHQVSNQQRNLLIFETVIGRSKLAGKMGSHLEEATQDIAREIHGMALSDAWKKTVEFCNRLDLKIFFSPYGTCLPIKSSAMRCHDNSQTPSGLRFEPNYEAREPSLCAGCDNFVMDYRHIPFWKERYLQNWISFKIAEKHGETQLGQFKVIHGRAQQAEKLLIKIGVDCADLEEQVKVSVESRSEFS